MSDPKPPAAGSKNKAFKPRAGIVRKSKAEREAHAKEEVEKAASRAEAAAKVVGKAAPTPKPNVTRKRELPRDNRDNSQGASTGVFGAGTGATQRSRKPVVDGGLSEILDGQEGVKAASTPAFQVQESSAGEKRKSRTSNTTAGVSIATEGRVTKTSSTGPAFESEDEPEERRRDIDRIWISSDEETSAEMIKAGKGKARATSEGKKSRSGTGLRPVRAPRLAPDEQDAGSSRRKDRRTTKTSRTAPGDLEGHDDGDGMELDEDQSTDPVHPKQDMPSSPELSRRTKSSRKSGPRTKESKLSTETVEERAERLRLSEDLEKLREEFMPQSGTKVDEHLEQQETRAKPGGKLFLFQFPPLVPFLADQTSPLPASQTGRPPKAHSGPRIKNEVDESMLAAPSEAEDGPHTAATQPRTRMEGMLMANEPMRLPPGRVGKLKLHKSGKVTLDWGGTDMEVRYGTEVDFLQDAVLVETPKHDNDQEDGRLTPQRGTSYALGPIEKKMVVIPDWQKLYD